MECPRCHFQNIPGQTRCFRCRSALEAEVVRDVHPPRAARVERWGRRVVRGLRRWLNAARRGRRREATPAETPLAPEPPLGGLLLSVLPGLGHWVQGRFPEVRGLWLVWLVLLGLTPWFFGTPPGWMLLGPLIACHAWIALRAGMLDYLGTGLERAGLLLATVGVLALLYVGAVPWALGIRFGTVRRAVPALGVEAGDVLLFRTRGFSTETLTPGSIVVTDLRALRLGQHGSLRTGALSHNVVAQFVAGPGRRVALAAGPRRFVVDGQVQDPNLLRVPRWLWGVTWSMTLSRETCFVSHDYHVGRMAVVPTNTVIAGAALVPRERIRARAVRLWWPLGRRHALP